ncbi:MAG: signal recognition particle receptor subunit alpha, partial [Pseudomonadales bacterium]
MFESLRDRLGSTFSSLTGKAKLTEDNIQDALREVRVALLEADVALSVVKDFIERVKGRALGVEVTASLSPGQVFIKIVNDELTAIMGEGESALNLAVQPPAVILMAGLQGAGKTTSTAKLGRWLQQREKKSVMVASTDVYRPAAIDQLQTLAEQADLKFFESSTDQKPLDIARGALDAAKKQFADVLIIDTAGRLHVDEGMMAEIRELHGLLSPIETLFVVDALTGQDAANTARSFGEVLPLTG